MQELGTAAGEKAEVVLAQLEVAAEAAIIEPVGATAGSYRFTHALTRETLYEEIPTPERLRWHGRVGDTLASIHGTRLTAAVSRIAYHYYEAAALGYAEKAADLGVRAAENAMAVYAFEEAAMLCDRAISALSLDVRDDARLARTYLLKSCALTPGLGAVQQAIEALLQALRHPLALEDAELLVDITTRLAWNTSFAPQFHTLALLEKALGLLPRGDSISRAKGLAALAFAHRSAGDPGVVTTLVGDSVEMAERLGDAAVLCLCLLLSIMALRGRADSLPRRLSLGRRFIDVADAYAWQLLNLMESGRIEELDALLDNYRRLRLAKSRLHQTPPRSP